MAFDKHLQIHSQFHQPNSHEAGNLTSTFTATQYQIVFETQLCLGHMLRRDGGGQLDIDCKQSHWPPSMTKHTHQILIYTPLSNSWRTKKKAIFSTKYTNYILQVMLILRKLLRSLFNSNSVAAVRGKGSWNHYFSTKTKEVFTNSIPNETDKRFPKKSPDDKA